MKRTFRSAIAGALLALAPLSALAQTSPNWSYRYVPTQAEWNAIFASKQDYLGASPLLRTGGTMTGTLVTAPSIAAIAGLNIPPGTAPTSPNNGDFWSTSAGFFGRVNGVTVGPFAQGTSGSFTGSSPIVVSFPGGGVVNYACATCGIVGNPLSQFAATTSAQLASIISNETGTNLLVFNTSPSLVTPALGVATATSINGIAITAGSGTLALGSNTFTIGSAVTISGPTTIASGGFTQAGAFATTLTSTATTNSTLPAGTHTLAGLDVANQTFSGTVNHTGPFQIAGTAQTFPASGLLVGTTDSQTLAAKTLTASSNVLGGVTMTLGSDAEGDIYYRHSGVLTRLPVAANGTVLELVSGIPSWQSVSGTGTVNTAGTGLSLSGGGSTLNLALTNASVQASPTVGGGAGSTPAMQGFGSACKLTPVYSGRVHVHFTATVSNNTASNSTSYNARHGTGAAPVFNATATGTAVLSTMTISNGAANNGLAIETDEIITGLTPGTAYWFDMIINSSANTSLLASPNCNVQEF